MLRFNIVLIASLMISGSFSVYDEDYRPQVHFSPPKGWINDPNGLVFHDGIYHLFFQFNPDATEMANIHWGHAVSRDLVFWKNLGVAIAPTDGNLIYSGSATIDYNNITGLQVDENTKTFIALFTAHGEDDVEKQWLAYSLDGPEYNHFELIEHNSVIPNPDPSTQTDFRDPAVFKYKDHYVTALAAHDRIMLYSSYDLINWTYLSDFGTEHGSHDGTWECPSLIPMNMTIDGEQIEKYVLIISLSGSVVPTQQYFIGSFDGKTFTNENSKNTVRWLDFGPDSYAGITYNPLPDGRRVFISWMNRWEYAMNLDFNPWAGQMGIPRELQLIPLGNEIRLTSLPVSEFKKLRTEQYSNQNVLIKNNYVYEVAEIGDNKTEHLLDVEMTLDLTYLKKSDSFDIVFSGANDCLNISFKDNQFTLDRSNAGRTDFPNFSGPWKAHRFIDSPNLKLRMIVDRSSIELFADDGLTVMTAIFFSKEDLASKMTIQVHSAEEDCSVLLKELNVYPLKGIWN